MRSSGANALRAVLRVLGNVEVRIDGRIAESGHARQRSCLAASLLNAIRIVPVDQLIDGVWADRTVHR